MSVHISTILESFRSSTRLLRVGETIFVQGDPATCIYRLECGHVKLSVEPRGGRIVCAFLFPGDLFGQFPGPRGATAVAVSDVVLKTWPAEPVFGICGRSPEILMALASTTDLNLQGLRRAAHDISGLPPTDRVIWLLNWLVRRERSGATTAGLPLSRREMGELLELDPRALGKAMSDLEALGYLHANSAGHVALRPAVFNGGQMADIG
ncbi:MAG: Crp/Fnr family transcriptional regulator [Hyphomonadaceae bacterium]